MTRPTGWHVLSMSEDPTPGDPFRVRVLARSAGQMAADAAAAHSAVRSLASDGAVLSWVGLAGDVFRGAIDDFPVQLGKLQDSYEQAADALGFWAGRLDEVQSTADRALEQGKQAQYEIDALSAQLASARSQVSSAAAASQRLGDQPPGVPPPSPEQVRAATRDLNAAQDRVGSLSSSLTGAQSRLDAATRMAEQARELRQSSARTVKHRLEAASDAGIAPKSRWEKFKEAASKAWDITVTLATVVVAVLSVLAIVMGGPLVWGILFALSAVLLADSLAKYARGEGSLFDVGLNMLGVIPGGRLLGAAGRLIGSSARGARAVSAVSRGLSAGRGALTRMTSALRGGIGTVVHRGLSAGFDSRLGARFLPRSGHLGEILRGYDRYGGLTKQEFLARYYPGGQPAWPPHNGFDGPPVRRTLQPGEQLDRFGPTHGRYLSPDGTPYPQRAIPPTNLNPLARDLDLHRYVVTKPLDVYEGPIAPAFGQPGGAVQQFVDGSLLGLDLPPGTRVNVQWLIDNGYLAVRP